MTWFLIVLAAFVLLAAPMLTVNAVAGADRPWQEALFLSALFAPLVAWRLGPGIAMHLTYRKQRPLVFVYRSSNGGWSLRHVSEWIEEGDYIVGFDRDVSKRLGRKPRAAKRRTFRIDRIVMWANKDWNQLRHPLPIATWDRRNANHGTSQFKSPEEWE